jgi:hypothetical protein
MLEKMKPILSARKLMASVFWDRKSVLTEDFMQQRITVTLEVYCETLKNFLGPFRTNGVNYEWAYIIL